MCHARLIGRCCFGLIVAALLAGCVTTLAPVRPLTVTASGDAEAVAVAIQNNGLKHYIWTECSGADTERSCALVYVRTRMGSISYQHVFTIAPGAQNKYPDLAVTDDGRAFIVRSICNNTTGICTDYYSVIPATVDATAPIETAQLALPAAESAGPPVVAARGNVVYAAYLALENGNTRPRYRQLSGGASGGYLNFSSSDRVSDIRLAISSGGIVHAVWKRRSDSTASIEYSNNLDTTGDVTRYSGLAEATGRVFDSPDIALSAGDVPYVVYSYETAASDVVRIYCFGATTSACFKGTIHTVVPLSSAQNPWRLRGSPHIQILGSTPAIVFSADNAATENNEIWFYQPPESATDWGPQRSTTNSLQDDEPLIVKENSEASDVAVVGWRTYITIVVPPNPPVPGYSYDCLRDVYQFHFNNSALRKVFSSTEGCLVSSVDLAANGRWVAGVWTDRLSAESGARHVPWTTFNAYRQQLPAVRR